VIRPAALACLAMVVSSFACGPGGSTASATPSSTPVSSPSPSSSAVPTLTPADRVQLAQLEKRPLKTPAPAADGQCHQGPFTSEILPYANGNAESEVYGAGPVYGVGSPPIQAGNFDYFDVTYITDPSVQGVVLVRINDLSGKYHGRFVGPLATGAMLGTNSIRGQQYSAYSELALPAGNPPANVPATKPGWGVWHVLQGIDQAYTCAAIQIDTASGTEVVLGH
jgi:hypothetical protein